MPLSGPYGPSLTTLDDHFQCIWVPESEFGGPRECISRVNFPLGASNGTYDTNSESPERVGSPPPRVDRLRQRFHRPGYPYRYMGYAL